MLALKSLLASFLLSISLAVFAQQNTDYLTTTEHQFWHDNSTLSEITMSFSQASWDELLQSSRTNRNEVSANMTYANFGTSHTLTNIGIKLSGNTSFVLPVNSQGDLIQANFTLDFDEFVDDQSLQGIAALKLKRFKDDATFVREPLSNHIMQNFGIFTAHSSSHVKVFIERAEQAREYIGIYRLNESVNRKEYIDKRFGTNNDGGFLWQGNYKAYGPALFSRITAQWDGVADADDASFEYKSKGSKFAEAKEQLVRLAGNLTNLEGEAFYTYADQHINMPLFLKMLAAEAVLGHWDGFWGNANNYMFYIDEQEVIHFIPFDTDNTLGTSAIVRDAGEQSTVQFGASNNTPPLITKVLNNDAYLAEFLRNTQALVTQANLMSETESVAYINSIHELIENDLQNVTSQNDAIADRPASWGNQSQYRLFETSTGKNWYATRQAAVMRSLGLPTANAGADITAVQGSTITLDASGSSDAGGEIISYEWSNGLTGVSPELSLDTAGLSNITLTVTDNFGFTSTDTVMITTQALPFAGAVPESTNDSAGAFSVYTLLSLCIFAVMRRNTYY